MAERHSVVTSTIHKHLAEAELAVARLESQVRTVPATRRSSSDMLRMSKRLTEAQAIRDEWLRVFQEVTT